MLSARAADVPAPRQVADHHGWAPTAGLIGALFLVGLAMVVPAVTGWEVYVGFPPLNASWQPRVGIGTVPASALAALGVAHAGRLSHRLPWGRLLLLCWVVGVGWLLSLALVDGVDGIRSNFEYNSEFLLTARGVRDIPEMLRGYASHIEYGSGNLSIQPATHPPGALLFFVLLVRLGLGSSLAVGLVVTLLASTVPLATMTSLRLLGEERSARLAAPFLVLAPAAIWETLSGDAVFMSFAAWGLAALAAGAVRRRLLWSLLGGLLLGTCVMMSYGLPLLGFLALAILVATGTYQPLGWAVGAAATVVAAFSVAGFSLLRAYPLLHHRYWAGVASVRPNAYWLWGDLAALLLSAGPALGPGVACWVWSTRRGARAVSGGHRDNRVARILGAAGLLSVGAADLSLMSKGEVERIWLPFVPWLLVLCALLPPRWRRPALALQVVTALLTQHLLHTIW